MIMQKKCDYFLKKRTKEIFANVLEFMQPSCLPIFLLFSYFSTPKKSISPLKTLYLLDSKFVGKISQGISFGSMVIFD